MIMEKLVNTIKLMAKSGLFFANCDGQVSIHERDFIHNFLRSILEVGEIDEALKLDVVDTLNHTYTLDEIIRETQKLVEGFNDDERKAILVTMSGFIQKVISSDGRFDPTEHGNYNQWKAALGLQ